VIADANGNLFGTTEVGGGGPIDPETGTNGGTVFEIAKTATGYASIPTTLVSFCSLANCADGAYPRAGLIIDANGNLFSTTPFGGVNYDGGTVFEIAKTATGYASTPTTLVSFNGTDGVIPEGGVIADTNGNLFGTTAFTTTLYQGDSEYLLGYGTVFEITDSGFVIPVTFAGTPGKANCHGQSVSALARQYGGLNSAAAALGYADVSALQNAILSFCEG
jgi:hypothetical protein